MTDSRNSARDLGTWPSREEILALGAELDERYDVDHGDVELVRAVLARWGRPTSQQELQPVPVSERPWKREGWCDDHGYCWWFDSEDPGWVFDDSATCRHWADYVLPANALPTPEATND